MKRLMSACCLRRDDISAVAKAPEARICRNDFPLRAYNEENVYQISIPGGERFDMKNAR